MAHDTQNALNDLPKRYHSAIGWDGPKPDKQREAERIRRRDEALLDNLLEIRTASEWMRDAGPAKPRRDLFPNLWCEGDLAVLVGPPGIGRSILAVQIAETIARGSSIPHSSLHIPHSTVVYFDLERTPHQFAERYSARAANGRMVKYRFARRHQRTHVGWPADHLRRYGYGREEMLVEALARKASSMDAPVMIVEDLTQLTGVHASANEIREILRRFRRWCSGINSALVIAEADTRDLYPRAPRGAYSDPHSTLRTHHSKRLAAILAEADSVFALCPSRMSPDLRYIKVLKGSSEANSSPLPLASANGSQLEEKGGVDAGFAADGVIDKLQPAKSPSLFAVHSSLLPDPVPAYRLTRSKQLPSLFTIHSSLLTGSGPFVGLQYLGLTLESEHTRDYAAEALNAGRTEERDARRRKLSARDALALGVLDGSYARYLLGE